MNMWLSVINNFGSVLRHYMSISIGGITIGTIFMIISIIVVWRIVLNKLVSGGD